MYRNCPEHPEIAEFLQKGELEEKKIAKKWIIFEEVSCAELQFGEILAITAEEYGEVCQGR